MSQYNPPCPEKNYIYMVYEVATGDVVYVGRTENLNNRLSMHRRWMRETPGKYDTKVIEEVYWFEAKIREYYWIKYYHAHGSPLRNIILPAGRRVMDTSKDLLKCWVPPGYEHKILMA